MAKEENGIFGEEKSGVSVREMLMKYLAYWPLFLTSVVLCAGIGVLYSRHTVPKYIATTSFLIVGSGGQKEDLVESALKGSKEINLSNELLMLNTKNLMERTVAKNGFNILYYIKGKLLSIELYKDAPFTLIPKNITDSSRTYTIFVKNMDENGGMYWFGSEDSKTKFAFKWDVPFTIDNQVFVLSPKRVMQKSSGEYIATWLPISSAAAILSANYSAKAFDPKTNAIQLTVKTENLAKGKDVLNAVFTEFNQSDIEDRNKLSRSTVQFIDDRLVNITGELKGVEGNLENYQGSNQLIDIKAQSSQSMGNSNTVLKEIQDLGIQQGVVTMISEYFARPSNGSKLVPSSLGLNDPTLGALIAQYNELQLRKEREAPLVAPGSTVMQDLNTQLASLKSSIMESLSSISKNLQLKEENLKQQNNQYQSLLSSVPHNERVMQEIKRKQSITEGLYLYLLQKREEAAISSTASTVAHYKQLDPAQGFGPIEPNTQNNILYASLLGLALAFGFISIKDLLNDKISSKEDILKRTSLPLLGQISHVSKKKRTAIAVLDRSVIGEQFRAIRTNLFVLLKDKNKKVILITSSTSGEGKSFVSLNLASVFAMPGKKVALLEFDVRQPMISNNLKIDNSVGLTNYLNGEVKDLNDIMQVCHSIPQLHIFPSGPIPENPADLLLTENTRRLFRALDAAYDYVIVDTPPANLVSDAFILSEYSDNVVYILRNETTAKKQLDYVNEIVSNNSLKNVSLVLNDIKKADTYGYGYGYDGNYRNSNKVQKKSLVVN